MSTDSAIRSHGSAMRSKCGLAAVLLVPALWLLGSSSSSASTASAPDSTVAATSSDEAQPTPTSDATSLRLVAIGDSIPFNSPDDCPGCTGFVDQYGESVGRATGRSVQVVNLSEHNGLTLPRLIDELPRLDGDLAAADIIVVGIAHNSIELNADMPCGAPLVNDLPDWTAIDQDCSDASTATYRPQYDELFSHIATLRAGQPTILRTINRYDDWNGWPGHTLTDEEASKIRMMIDDWDTMLCDSAEANGFVCADIHAAFNGADGLQPSGDLLGGDYTHPSQAGNDLIATVLEDSGYAPLA